MMKLWDKGIDTDLRIETFTVGMDRELDLYLAAFDVLGSLAHIRMLHKIGILNEADHKSLNQGLKQIFREIENGNFLIEKEVEDVHSQVEILLTRQLGEVGKKIHAGRSRNDQVLVDLRLFFRDAIQKMAENAAKLAHTLLGLSEKYKQVLMPGYTHFQVAMPSSFGLWFGAFAEALSDDLIFLQSAYRVIDQNPLGSAAGYGTSFPLDRKMTTELLGFSDLSYNVINAQMGRGKSERILAAVMGNLASTVGRLAMDVCLYNSQNFAFLKLPDRYTTGSSIMPHKKNPDVFELIRAKCNKIQALPQELALITANLPSGYHRDYQILKENLFPAIFQLQDCILIAEEVLNNLEVKENILEDPRYRFIFSVEKVNERVLQGDSFREAYRKIAADIENGTYQEEKKVNHTHEGSIGNLCNQEIGWKIDAAIKEFGFSKAVSALQALV